MPPTPERHGRPMRHVVTLPSGTLTLDVETSGWALEALCTFAVRASPRRGFLFVSRVLGKHLPARPTTMRETYLELARAVRSLAPPSPILFVGLAETATGLGLGVFEAVGADDALYIHTTRAEAPGAEVALRFAEPHSHAPEHVVYRPRDPDDARLFDEARTLVLVDDEISTGTTLANLAEAYHRVHPRLERIVLVSLTDWLAEPAMLEARMPAPTERVSLLRGRFDFRPNASYRAPALPPPPEERGARRCARVFGRFGTRSAPSAGQVRSLLELSPEARILVLGTGEHLYAPYRLALELEQHGRDVMFQSTTRSPILPGPSIESKLAFPDPLDGVTPSYLYNVSRERYDHIVVCYETAACAQHELTATLGAGVIHPEDAAWAF